MSKKTKKVFRMMSIVDYKSLEIYLETMAKKGWMLTEIKRRTLHFEEIEPQNLKFNVSLFYNTTPFDYPDEEDTQSYQELCEESGWTFVASNELVQVFYANDADNPTPIHTDSNEEYRIIRRTFMKTELISICMLLLLIASNSYPFFNFDYTYLYSNSRLLALISPLFLVLILIAIYGYSVIWLIKNKIALSKGESLEFSTYENIKFRVVLSWILIGVYWILIIFALSNSLSNNFTLIIAAFIPVIVGMIVGHCCKKRFKSRKRTRTKNIIFLSIAIIIAIVISTTAVMSIVIFKFHENEDVKQNGYTGLQLSDFGTVDQPERTRLHEESSIFVPIHFDYYETLGRKALENEVYSISTEYAKAINEEVATYLFDGFIKKEESRFNKRIKEMMTYNQEDAEQMKNPLSEIPDGLWHVDRGYYLWQNKSNVVLQKGDELYWLDGDVDFSDKDIIDICEAKLGIK